MHSPAPRGPQGSRLGITEWGSVGRGQVCRGFPGSSVVKESACSAGDLASIPGVGISSGEGSGYPLQHSCLENSMDRRAWQATVHGVAKSRTQLSNFTFTFHFHALEKKTATHSSVLAWRIPGTGETGGTGLHRVGHN